MTEEEKDVEQLNSLHAILSSFINDDFETFEKECEKVAKLHGDRTAMHVAFEVAQALDKNHRELINKI